MARLTREQSQALTRKKLLDSAYSVVARAGYAGATIERISEEAGFSKGAFYSNFASKEDIFIQLLERNAGDDVAELSARLDPLASSDGVVDALAAWVDERSTDQRWGMLAIEILRMYPAADGAEDKHLRMFRDQWVGLGEILLRKLFAGQAPPVSAFHLGGLVFELTYGGISGFLQRGAASEMVRFALSSIDRAWTSGQPKAFQSRSAERLSPPARMERKSDQVRPAGKTLSS